MSITSTDHVVVPESTEDTPTAEATQAPEAAEVTEASGPTFAELGLPEGVVRKLAQNGVTTP
ncbi:hypothetical protein NGM37_14875, partial [Streptomyces sp. TRM76130]|nr:hypothetical protein [Streptomyces sp. TRM76130]